MRRPSIGKPIFLSLTLGAIVGIGPFGSAQQEQTDKKTYTYKTVDQCKIQADVYQPDAGNNRPVVIWIHGGALIMGHRGQVDRELLRKLLKAGYVVVSID